MWPQWGDRLQQGELIETHIAAISVRLTRLPRLPRSNHSVDLSRKGGCDTLLAALQILGVANLSHVQRSSRQELSSSWATMHRDVHASTKGLTLTSCSPVHQRLLHQCPTKEPSISTPPASNEKHGR